MAIKKEYRGIEKRITQRREVTDRREMIRYEPDKTPRRSSVDRRISGSAWDAGYYRQ